MSIEKNTPSLLKHEQSPFTTLINETITQIKDAAALGIYCYLASKPGDWEISPKQLMNHFGKGRDFINDKLKYLRSIGALIVEDIRDERGRFIRRETLLKRTIMDTTTLKNQIVDNPDCGESLPTNKRDIQNKDINNNTVDSVESPPDDYKACALFMMFYALYPRKEKPQRAYKAFLQLKPTQEFVSMLCTDVQQRVENNWKNRHKSKIPHPATYLNDREWESEIFMDKSPIKKSTIDNNDMDYELNQRSEFGF